jgi:hypothetical protein
MDDGTSKNSVEIVKVEHAEIPDAERYLQGYPLLLGKSKDELDKLNKAVLKKLDWKFLFIITLMLLMKCDITILLLRTAELTYHSYLDRINVSNARLAGMQKDLHMTDVEWSAGISMFYVGYIISQIPANIIMAKQKPRIWLPCIMIAWSAVTICMPAATKPWHFSEFTNFSTSEQQLLTK